MLLGGKMHVELLMLISPCSLQPSWHSWRISQPWPWRIKQYPGMPSLQPLLWLPHTFACLPWEPKVHVQHVCTTGDSPWHFPASPGCLSGLSHAQRQFPFFCCKILAWDPVVQGEGSPSGSPNPGGWGQSCLESRAVPCPAVMCSFQAAFSVSKLSVFVWVSKMWLVSHYHVDSVHRFCVGTAILVGQVCKAVWSWDIFLPEIPTRIYLCTCINTRGNTCGSYIFFLSCLHKSK